MILYSAIYAEGYPFDMLFEGVIPVRNPAELTPNTGALVIWGGEDISPTLYGEKVSNFTNAQEILSPRDKIEMDLALEAIDIGMPIIAICRGAQLMCALAGGKVIQHTTGHLGDHTIITHDGQTLVTSSLHHQMLYPWFLNHKLLAWSESRSSVYINGDDEDYTFPENAKSGSFIKEPEIVLFPELKTLAIQGHPEFMRANDVFVRYCQELTKDLIRE